MLLTPPPPLSIMFLPGEIHPQSIPRPLIGEGRSLAGFALFFYGIYRSFSGESPEQRRKRGALRSAENEQTKQRGEL